MSFHPRSPSLESAPSSPLSPATNLDKDQFSTSTRTNKPSPPRRHERYYFFDGNVTFLVDGVLYNIHRYFFQRDSSNFASMFSLPFGGRGQGMTDDEPITLPKVKASDFDLFLSVLYPMEFGQYTATTVSEWTAILDLAAKWNFKSVRALAVKHLAPIASPIDKIVLGRKHSINEWLGDAYRSVCMRPEPLTHDEGMRLGMGDVIKISAIRYDYGLRLVRRSPLSLNEELQKRFGLDSPAFPTLHDALNMKEEEAAKPQTRKSVEDWLEKAQLEKPMEVPMDDYADLDTRTHKSVESWLEKTQPKNIAVPVDNYVDFDKHQGPIDWTAVTDDGEAHAYEPVREIIETTDRAENDDSMGRDVRPLTRPQQKKKKQQEAKEAKERADRAFQEQLEKELAEEGMKDDPSLYNDRYY